MPIYEYQCAECAHRLEKLQKLGDPPATLCPACEKPGLGRLISAAAFRLKGSGWYETDFKKSQKKKNISSGDTAAESSGEGGSGDKTVADNKKTDSRSGETGTKQASSG